MTSSTMQAAVLNSARSPFQIGSIPRPEPAQGQVLVRIQASAVNPLDLKIHSGEAAHARHPLPGILGIDLAGVVESVGAGVTQFRAGDEYVPVRDIGRRRPRLLLSGPLSTCRQSVFQFAYAARFYPMAPAQLERIQVRFPDSVSGLSILRIKLCRSA